MHNFREVMEGYRLRLHDPQIATRVWNVLLNDEERNRLGDLQCAFDRGGSVWIWAEAKQISIDRATIDLARWFGMSDFHYREIMAVIAPDEVGALNVPVGRPVWNRKLGELSLGGKVIRRISGLQRATKIVPILDAFEANRWPVSIDIAKIRTSDVDELGQTVRSLNRGLDDILFGRDGSGSGVRWRVRD